MMTFTAAAGPELLHQYVAAGFLLHGSPRADIVVLEPRAVTHDPHVDCDRPVVFATRDPVIAVVFALLDRCRWCGTLDIESVPRPGLPAIYRINVQATSDPIAESGTVWVVPPESFRQLPGRTDAMVQWASDEPVRPVASVHVSRHHLRVPVAMAPCPPSPGSIGAGDAIAEGVSTSDSAAYN